MSDDTGSEWWIHNFLQSYKVPSETTTTQRQNPFNQPPPHAELWVFMHSRMLSEGHGCERPGNHLASHTCSSLLSSQNKSACAQMVGEPCWLRLWCYGVCHTTKSQHWIGMISAPVIWHNHLRHARHGVINHCSVSLPHNASNYLPWAVALLKLPQTLYRGTHFEKYSPFCPSKILGSAWLLL